MELHAYTRTISDLFSVKRKYVVPRFQREYSWTKEQVRELWDDIVTNITITSSDSNHEEYFIGVLVLVGDDKSSSLQIVDGQQRLTTITILLSVLCDRFLKLRKDNLAESIYENYIAGKDDDGNYYFKLENETPKPFFQKSIQHIKKVKAEPQSEEEKVLMSSYSELYSLTSRDNLARQFRIYKGVSNELHVELLKALREQVVKYLKVIFITVTEEEEAYTIFETLNARGMNLSFVDLIKNKLFKELNDVHPDDDAKTTWKHIRDIISSRDNIGSLETFVRHWWISKYSYVSADNVYKTFKKLWKAGKIDANKFIFELHSDSKIYVEISSPISEDFRQQEEKAIFNALMAFRVFGLTQQRPFLLSLFKARERGVVKLAEQKDILIFLERFHFMFNAVCSLRPSGVEASYSRAARDLHDAENRREAKAVLNTLKDRLYERVPEESTFVEKFSTLKFYKGYTKDKKLIQYVFSNIEKSRIKTNELAPENISLEHILSQSKDKKETVGKVGNLLPLSQDLNVDAKK
ncbi:MAG: DUF262 domain-containing protein [Pseudomonadota bacterium]